MPQAWTYSFAMEPRPVGLTTTSTGTTPRPRRQHPQVGDVAFWKFSDSWASNYSASHAGIVIEVNGGNVVIVDAAYGNIGVRSAYSGARYAHPYYDE